MFLRKTLCVVGLGALYHLSLYHYFPNSQHDTRQPGDADTREGAEEPAREKISVVYSARQLERYWWQT